MFREINKLESFFFSIEATDFYRKDKIIKEFQKVLNFLVIVIFRIFGKVYKLFLECGCLISFFSFFYVWFIFVIFCYFSASIFIHLYFLQNINDRQYILNLVIKHLPFSLNFLHVFLHGSTVKFRKKFLL
jgi:hypothetical protein